MTSIIETETQPYERTLNEDGEECSFLAHTHTHERRKTNIMPEYYSLELFGCKVCPGKCHPRQPKRLLIASIPGHAIY